MGCVFVKDGAVVGRGHNETIATCNATRHAELVAIDGMLAAGMEASELAGCTL